MRSVATLAGNSAPCKSDLGLIPSGLKPGYYPDAIRRGGAIQ